MACVVFKKCALTLKAKSDVVAAAQLTELESLTALLLDAPELIHDEYVRVQSLIKQKAEAPKPSPMSSKAGRMQVGALCYFVVNMCLDCLEDHSPELDSNVIIYKYLYLP